MYNIKPADVSMSYEIAINSNGTYRRDDVDADGWDCDVLAQIEFSFKFNKLDKNVEVAREIYIPFSSGSQEYNFKGIIEVGTSSDWQIDCDDLDFIESEEVIDFIENSVYHITDGIISGEVSFKYYHY